MDTTLEPEEAEASPSSGPRRSPCLMVAWCRAAPHRVGELLRLPERGVWSFGRGEAGGNRLTLLRLRPGQVEPQPALEMRVLSREQLRISRVGVDRLRIENVGKCPLEVRGRPTDSCEVKAGDIIELRDQLLLLATSRADAWAPLRDHAPTSQHAYGQADADGLVGESEVAWALRERVAFAAKRRNHVLITGPSGVGKELVARAIHAQSTVSRGPLVSRNAATLPHGLIDAELFGNARNYPNPGMAERPGLIGEAHGGTLFLDEIGELPTEMQAHLLRVLDHGGEYQRLGETGRRNSTMRLIAATNRLPEELKVDLLARLSLRIDLEGLAARIDDVPLLAIHLLRRIASSDRELGGRFFEQHGDDSWTPRLDAELMRALLEHPWVAHVRELEAILWRALASSPGNTLALTPAVRELALGPADLTQHHDVSPELLRASLLRNDGNREKVWRELKLANRYVLRRLLKKHGLDPQE